MKLAVSTYSLSRWRRENSKTMEQSLDAIVALGAAGVEFAGLDDKPVANPIHRARLLRKHAAKAGIQIAGYCVSAELLRPADAQRAEVDRIKSQLNVAAELGVKTFRHDITFGFGQHARELNCKSTFANALKIVAPAIREIADYALTLGIKSSLENHGFFMQAPDRVEKLIRFVNHKNFGLTMDMGNFLCVNADPVRAVRSLAKYAQMVHVKDFHVRKKSAMPPAGWFATPTHIALRGAIVGHGEIDIPAQMRILKSVGYTGWLSLEFEGIEEPIKSIRMGLEYLQTLIK